MNFRHIKRPEIVLLALAAVLRIGGIALSTAHVYSYSANDAIGFSHHARRIAMTTLAGQPQTGLLFRPHLNLLGGMVKIYNLWGLILSPVYLLAGPSAIYARFALATLSVLAVWNIFVLGQTLHSRRTGLIAAFPVAVYPSFVLVHSTLLREATVLFLLTGVARLAIAPPERLSRTSRVVLCGIGLVMTALLRWELWTLELLTVVVGTVVYLDATTNGGVRDWLRTHRTGTLVIAIPVLYGAWRVAERAARYLTSLHLRRAEGRTVYLADVAFRQVPQMLAFAPVAALYFLFTPFPWMVATPADAVIAVEALGNVAFAVAAVWGVRTLVSRSMSARIRAGWVALAIWFVAGSVLFGLGTANVGTAVRHRQMFVWVLYLFGAVGVKWLPRKWAARLPFEIRTQQ
ncbi:MAG TPA: hypothetical protein VFJ06_00145 [Halococcus sp.]|nr:hypothetical protein [Halococcus sp.]